MRSAIKNDLRLIEAQLSQIIKIYEINYCVITLTQYNAAIVTHMVQILATSKHISLETALASLSGESNMQRFLTDLCTPAELRALRERWLVAQILNEGKASYRDINAQTGVSTTTIGRVARFLKDEPHQGYRIVLDRTPETTD